MVRCLLLLTCATVWLNPCAVPAQDDTVLPGASQRFSQSTGPEIPDFQRHVMPLVGRLGCNGRACHGSFQGRGGFSLSLFGHDFSADHSALTGTARSIPGKRINVSQPADSLILQKAGLLIEHEGGQLLQPGSWQQNLLQRWVAAGAPGIGSSRSIVRLELQPRSFAWTAIGSSDDVSVHAVWSDGLREDVTCLTRFRTNDDAVASVTEDGRVAGVGFGDTHIIAFYDNAVAALPVIMMDPQDRKSTRLNSSHVALSRMPSSA